MEETVWRMFSKTASIYPDCEAVIDSHGTMTYKQLGKRARQWARWISASGAEGGLVGVMVDHSAEQIAAILGVLATGCGYIPMEPDFPQERVNSMLADGRVTVIITQRRYARRFDNKFQVLCTEDLDRRQPSRTWTRQTHRATGIAYVLFTSGTTGRPKGVMVSHQNLLHYVRAFQQEFHLTPEDRVLQMSVVNFDIYVEEVFPALLNGSCVCVINQELKNDVRAIADYCNENAVTVISSFPYFLQKLNTTGLHLEKVRVFISGGDVLHKRYIDKLLPYTPVYNTYGPTETTVCAAYHRCDIQSDFDRESIPIGFPVSGANMEIVDEQLHPLKPGEIGEICISGSGVSLGYLNRPEETAYNFVSDPSAPEQYRYLSGDMGYKNQNGEFFFLYRKDGQVMIEGRRVECMEVEMILNQCPFIVQAVVKAIKDHQGLHHLVAFLKLETGNDLQRVKEYLRSYLLDYMIPEYFVPCEEFPLTASGKLDRKSLTFTLSA